MAGTAGSAPLAGAGDARAPSMLPPQQRDIERFSFFLGGEVGDLHVNQEAGLFVREHCIEDEGDDGSKARPYKVTIQLHD